MFFTMTMLLVFCVKMALLISLSMLVRLPEVRKAYACATRSGVRASPSRSGSSPISTSNSRISASILAIFGSIFSVLGFTMKQSYGPRAGCDGKRHHAEDCDCSCAVTPISRDTRMGTSVRCNSSTRSCSLRSAIVIRVRSRTYSAHELMI